MQFSGAKVASTHESTDSIFEAEQRDSNSFCGRIQPALIDERIYYVVFFLHRDHGLNGISIMPFAVQLQAHSR